MPSRWPTNDHRPFVRSLSIFCPFEYPHPRSLKFDKVKYTPRFWNFFQVWTKLGLRKQTWKRKVGRSREFQRRGNDSSLVTSWSHGPIRFLVKTFFLSLPPRNFFPLFPVNYRPHRWYLHSSAIPRRKCNFPWVNLSFLPIFFSFFLFLSLPFQSYP